MKILFISKYPPIEGGVSARNYWLAKALGERGVEVSIITNALQVETEYREEMYSEGEQIFEELQPKNVFFNSLNQKPPAHIPYSEAYLSRLINLGLKVIGQRGADVIYTHYLEPYAAAGYILKQMTGLPLVVKHAGSDIYRLLKNPDYRYFLGRVISGADRFLSFGTVASMAESMGLEKEKIVAIPSAIDTAAFSPDGPKFNFAGKGFTIPPGVPIITYIGKAQRDKWLEEILEALSGMSANFRLVMVSKGPLLERFIAKATEIGIKDKVIHLGFVPPWEIPKILRASDLLLHLENNFSIPIHGPQQPYEAIACRTPLLLSAEGFKKMHVRFPVNSKDFMVVQDPKEIPALRKMLELFFASPEVFMKSAVNLHEEFISRNDWDKSIASYIKLFESLKK